MKDIKVSDFLVILRSRRLFRTNVKVITIPLVGIIVIVILFFATLKIGYPRITVQLEQLRNSQEKELSLSKKLNALRGIQPGVLENSNKTLMALPQSNPSAYLVSLINIFAKERSMAIKKITMLPSNTQVDNLESVQLELEIAGSDEDMLATIEFLKSFQDSLPISNIVKHTYKSSSGDDGNIISFEIYWSTLPEKIPSIDEPINNLTAEETLLLNKIISHKLPEFTSLKVSSPSDRENPFE